MPAKNHLPLAALFILSALSMSMPAHAAFKCWKNHEGIRECGNKVPPEFAQQGHQEISAQGMIKSEQARTKTSEELAEEARLAAIAAEKQRQAEQQARQDKLLLDTYTDVGGIERKRDEDIATIQSSINLASKRREKIQQDLNKLIAAAATVERAGKTPNENLQKDIASLRRQVKDNEKFIAGKLEEQETVKASYAEYIDRFNTLTGAKPAN